MKSRSFFASSLAIAICFSFLAGMGVAQRTSGMSGGKVGFKKYSQPDAPAAVSSTPELSSSFVISQAYGGGGGSTGTYINDYVELKNVSTSPKSLLGLSLFYGSSTGQFASTATNAFALPNVSVQPGGYFLVQLGAAGTAGAPLPVTPDATTTNLSMAAGSGKVALVAGLPQNSCGATATPCALPNFLIVDVVSYGASNNAEGGAPTNGGVAITSTQGNVRKTNGCTDTDNNNADFDIITAPVPKNSATATAPCGILTNTRTVLDFDGDGRTDYAVARDSNGPAPGGLAQWYISLNSSSASYMVEWGQPETDDFAYGDYDGDGKTDIGAWRRDTGSGLSTFYVVLSSNNTFLIDQLGLVNDDPVVGDYNGDGKADPATYRNNGDGTSSFFYRPNQTSEYITLLHNGQGSKAVGDYDGDGKTDPATFGPGAGGVGEFKVTRSTGGTLTATIGLSTDIVAPGDYDGDGRTDFCVIRQNGANWQWDYGSSAGGSPVADTWGLAATDVPAPGDYNGDGRTDYCVWRSGALSEFFVMTPQTRLIFARQWGLEDDFPAATAQLSNTGF